MIERLEVWRVSLERAEIELTDRLRLLSGDERVRARRFARAGDGASFVLVRSTLRGLLAARLGRPAASLRFRYESAGRPVLVDELSLRFSVSHTDTVAYIAINENGANVGVDVEAWKAISPADIGSVLSDAESSEVFRGAEPLPKFYDLWTKKEAVLKAAGIGLAATVRELEISTDRQSWVGGFFVQSLSVRQGHSASLAIDCRESRGLPRVVLRGEAS